MKAETEKAGPVFFLSSFIPLPSSLYFEDLP
jgi:hypothetical protein